MNNTIKISLSPEALCDALHVFHRDIEECERVGKEYEKVQLDYSIISDDYRELILDNERLRAKLAELQGLRPVTASLGGVSKSLTIESLKKIINGIHHGDVDRAISGIRAITGYTLDEAKSVISDSL